MSQSVDECILEMGEWGEIEAGLMNAEPDHKRNKYTSGRHALKVTYHFQDPSLSQDTPCEDGWVYLAANHSPKHHECQYLHQGI